MKRANTTFYGVFTRSQIDQYLTHVGFDWIIVES